MRRHRVSFNRFASTTPVLSLKTLPWHIQDEIWYRTSDVEEFRSNARDLCRQLRQDSNVTTEDSVRGLEYRTSADRQTRKDLTIKCVLKAQTKTSSARTLAYVYHKCNAWTVDAAKVAAASDYSAAYDLPASDAPIPPMANYPLPFRYRSHKKRTSEICSPSDPERRVRRKVIEAAA